MLRIKDDKHIDCDGKYLVNDNNIGLMVSFANQHHKNKAEFIEDFLKKVESYLNDLIEDDYEKCYGTYTYGKDIPF